MAENPIASAMRQVKPLMMTHCEVCGEPTLYMVYCDTHGRSCLQRKKVPKTCGRLSCMVATEEMRDG